MRKKAQISMEYLIIVGISSLIILPMLILFFTQMSDITESMTVSQVNKISDEIVNSVNEVYYLGDPAKKRLSFYLPNYVENIYFIDTKVIFIITLKSSSFSIIKYADVNVTGNISSDQGVHKIDILARSDDVLISEIY